ncbi:MAG: MaoC/PaaZ C-terminal domain-containing protein [Solirubrobacterales bacterium]
MAREVRELDSMPGTGSLYGKAALGAITGALPFGGGSGGDTLPDTELVLRDVEIDRDQLNAYNRVCGFGLSDTVPATFPHVLAFPVAMELMTSDEFPFKLLGLVHIENEITQHRPLEAGERLTFRVHADNLRPHRKGRQVDLVHTAEVDGETVWTDTSTYLRRGGGSGDAPQERSAAETDAEPAGPAGPGAIWKVPGDIGRRYASVSGDRNPIHLHPVTARAFGFPGAIAHGMWTKARSLAAFEGRLPDAYTIGVEFKLPLILPGRVNFTARRAGDAWSFELEDLKSGKPHLAGRITPLDE